MLIRCPACKGLKRNTGLGYLKEENCTQCVGTGEIETTIEKVSENGDEAINRETESRAKSKKSDKR